MTLLSIARAMDDANFRWRIQAAMLKKAKAEFPKPAGTPEWNFAVFILSNPQISEPSMFAMVAIDDKVAAAVQVDDNGTVDTSAVTDDDISRVVDEAWPTVSKKYAASPPSGNRPV